MDMDINGHVAFGCSYVIISLLYLILHQLSLQN